MLGLGLTCRPGNRLCGSPAQRPVICSAALVGSDARRRADCLRAELCEKWYCLYCGPPRLNARLGQIVPALCQAVPAGPLIQRPSLLSPCAHGCAAPLSAPAPWLFVGLHPRSASTRSIWRRVHGSSHAVPSCSCQWSGLSGSDRSDRYRLWCLHSCLVPWRALFMASSFYQTQTR